VDPTTVTGLSVSRAWPLRKSEAGTDMALLFCALFLQRFSLAFGNSLLSLDAVPTVCILIHQFASGRLLVLYDRLLWFLVLGLVTSYSLYLNNFNSSMLPSYGEFIVFYFLFTLSRSATIDRYRSTLQAFQFLVLVLSCLAIAQFFAQFVVDGRALVQFFGIMPDFLFASFDQGLANTIIPITTGSSLIKSNGIFLGEPSTLSQMTALGILIEILEFRRPRYLSLLAFGYLLSYSGTGLMLLLLFLPMASLARRRAILYVLLIIIIVFGLSITGVVDLSIVTSRMGEFGQARTSGQMRFISPFWLAADYLDLASLRELLLGNGPGTIQAFAAQDRFWYTGGTTNAWIKLFYEYGLIGSFVFILFLATCFRKTLCPSIVVAAVLFTIVFLGGGLLGTPYLTIMLVLVTLNGSRSRPGRIDRVSRHPPTLAAESVAG